MYLDRFGFRLWSKWKPTSGAFFETRGTSVSSMTRYQTGGAKWVTRILQRRCATAIQDHFPPSSHLKKVGPFRRGVMARRASVTKPLSVIMAPTRSSRKVRAGRFGTAWARRVSQAQRGVGIEVSMGRNRRTSNTLQLRAVTLKRQQATKIWRPKAPTKPLKL